VFYRCFVFKDDLMAAVLAEGGRILGDYLMLRMAKARTPEEKIRAWITGVMRQAETAAERTRPFIVSPPEAVRGSTDPIEIERPLLHMLEEVIAAGVTAGLWDNCRVPATDALIIYDPSLAACAAISFVMSPTIQTIQLLAEFRPLMGSAPV
jgi:hypothetical protein